MSVLFSLFCIPLPISSNLLGCAGGQKKLRQLWKHYLKNTHALIFVVDSADRQRLREARSELKELMHRPELAGGGLLLVLANKQDLPGALPPERVAKKLRLKKVARKVTYHIQGTVGTTGNGLYEAIEWLSKSLQLMSETPRPHAVSGFVRGQRGLFPSALQLRNR